MDVRELPDLLRAIEVYPAGTHVTRLVWADRPCLMQVLLNLATNSIRALDGRENKAVRGAARAEGHRVVVEFTDNAGQVPHPAPEKSL